MKELAAVRLWKITYLSVSAVSTEKLESTIKEICAVADEHNSRAGITGVLTFLTGNFAQLLEGPQPELRELMNSIIADPRHHSLKVITDFAIEARRYPDWSMAYCDPREFLRDQSRQLQGVGSAGHYQMN